MFGVISDVLQFLFRVFSGKYCSNTSSQLSNSETIFSVQNNLTFMKQLLFVIICALAFSVSSLAQTPETFDIATFQPPNGWQKQTKDGVIIFSTSNKQNSSYAVITIYRSGDSSGNVKSDFEADWQEFILGQLGIKSKPELEPTTNVEGWEFIAGAAAFENETGKAAVILGTYSGYGRKFSSAAVFNSKDSLPAIEAFIGSIKLTKPARSRPASSNSESNASILGTWGMGSSGSVRYDDYKNPYSVNNYGYSKANTPLTVMAPIALFPKPSG